MNIKNSPCPCGSGKKTKHCCGDRAAKAEKALLKAVEQHQAGHIGEAETGYQALLDNPIVRRHALHYLGLIHFQRNEFVEARQLIEQAVALERNGIFFTNLGNACARCGDHEAALAAHREAYRLAPRHPEVILNLGRYLSSTGCTAEARDIYLRAEAVAMGHPELLHAVALAVFDLGNYDYCLELCRNARIEFGARDDFLLLEARLLMLLGNVDQALTLYGKIDLTKSSVAYGAWLFAKSTRAWPAADCLEAHARWHTLFGSGRAALPVARQSDAPSSTAGQRLRIGFLSPDLRRHAMRFFVRPMFRHLDRSRFQVHAFFCGPAEDDVSRELAGLVDHWHGVGNLPDIELAQLIRENRIDVLIDLAGHTANNRLNVLAMQAAPAQASMLGYLPTLAMPEVQYRLSDPAAVPDSMLHGFSETVLRFRSHSQWCYVPDTGIQISAAANARSDDIVFGSFHSAMKMSDDVLAAWHTILDELKDAQLVLIAWSASERAFLQKRLQQHSIPLDRVRFTSPAFGTDYWHLFDDIDISLDVFPYNGGTASVDALWMGIPVVSCSSDHPAGRGGASILSALGKPEWCASDAAAYAQTAIDLARSLQRGEDARRALRQTMVSSALMDEAGYVREFEQMINIMATAT